MQESSTTLLRVSDVARLLKVSHSSVKRYVDDGLIQASRTPGNQRRIPASAVLEYAQQRGLWTDELARLEESLTKQPAPASRLPRHLDRFAVNELHRLLVGDQLPEAQTFLFQSLEAFGSVATVDHLIRPVMERIGDQWQFGQLDVFHEHRASHQISQVLSNLIQNVTKKQLRDGNLDQAPVALGATPEGDLYSLPGLAIELVLRELGWDVVNLGPNLPLRSLARAVREYRPRLVWLSVNHLTDRDRFVREYLTFHQDASEVGTTVVLGGQALDITLQDALPGAVFGSRASHIEAFASGLFPEGAARQASRLPSSDGMNQLGPTPDREGM